MYKMRKMDQINIEDYAKAYPGTSQRYVNWRLQQQLFYQEFPNGSILAKPPEADPMGTADTWVSTVSVYTDKSDQRPAICTTARRGPSSEDVITDGEYIDPYKLCQIAAIGDALSALGFTAPILSNAEEEEYMRKSLDMPSVTSEASPQDETPQKESGETAPKEEQTTEKKPRKPRKKKETAEPEKVTEPEKTTASEKETDEKVTEPEKPLSEENPAEAAEKETQAAETASNPESGISSEEEARSVPCTYRNFNKYTIGQIVDMASENKGCSSFLKWCLESTTAARKCPDEVKAVKYLKDRGKF